ncbi:DUF2778 domain-containing protein [Burkholderia sp. FERM BP-3421]|uniref:DUF2778 domain-containing protein n=1 Tax=Burkholderia sp. FERM BP-3421 TaxID=1494466 RepID=UPI0023615A05|nr:DUF2778 domain-containing protein [Burkholderia sp. FERM BP-3421]WDD93303.1 DUF2778 domain-containing protein [Burkholderia sp. FERM BP-3421]
MPTICTFALNGASLSTLQCPGIGAFAAFSGMPQDRNKPEAVSHLDNGPLPPGRYYVVDRQSGGRMGWLYDFAREYGYGTNRSQWFALYRDDGKIDDETIIQGVHRGAFRLHPIGPQGRSEGCITLTSIPGFNKLAATLRAQGATIPIPGSGMKAYAIIEVR